MNCSPRSQEVWRCLPCSVVCHPPGESHGVGELSNVYLAVSQHLGGCVRTASTLGLKTSAQGIDQAFCGCEAGCSPVDPSNSFTTLSLSFSACRQILEPSFLEAVGNWGGRTLQIASDSVSLSPSLTDCPTWHLFAISPRGRG